MKSNKNKSINHFTAVFFAACLLMSGSLHAAKSKDIATKESNVKTEKSLTSRQKRGTAYLRIGGGIFNAKGITAKVGLDGSKIDSSSFFDAFAPGFNTELGFNHYAKRPFYFGMGLGVDLIMGGYGGKGAGTFIGDTPIQNILIEAKIKLGTHIDSKSLRNSLYLFVGAASQIYNDIKGSIETRFGPTAGLGFQITAKRYPIGFYAEASLPMLMSVQSKSIGDVLGKLSVKIDLPDPNNPTVLTPRDVNIDLSHIKTSIPSGLDIMMSPKVALGVQIGY